MIRISYLHLLLDFMINWFKRNKESAEQIQHVIESEETIQQIAELPAKKEGLFSKIKGSLSKTRAQLGEALGDFF